MPRPTKLCYTTSLFVFTGDREKASDIIINNEMLLMSHLQYQLTVHNPFRAVEGALIDIKVASIFLLHGCQWHH